jgi:hypothetical protein
MECDGLATEVTQLAASASTAPKVNAPAAYLRLPIIMTTMHPVDERYAHFVCWKIQVLRVRGRP